MLQNAGRVLARFSNGVKQKDLIAVITRGNATGIPGYRGLDQTILNKYAKLPQHEAVQVMYVWIDGTGQKTRAKTKTMYRVPESPADCSVWNYDGSSTGQAEGGNSDTFLHPRAIFPDPFRGNPNKIVLCDTYDADGNPCATNHRAGCEQAMSVEHVKEAKTQWGMEQEYTLFDRDLQPLGWPKQGYPGPQGPYYCGVGTGRVFGREIVEAHYRACMFAGIKIGGTNAEVMPAQWEYQIGPCEGISIGDEMWMSRYFLERVAEDFGVVVSLDPKPISGDWNGAGCHCNYSTEATRAEGGMTAIEDAIEKMSHRQEYHIRSYDPTQGEDNKRRLTGLHETASIEKFTSGVASRTVSVRIPRQTALDGKGYLEDRRPSSNCDPYAVTEAIVRTDRKSVV